MTALERLLVQRIERDGPMTFRDFMAEALYRPEHGYYATGKPWQGEGDFTTAPMYGETFALGVARFLALAKDAMGPGRFEAVEVGSGSGLLAAQLAKIVEGTGMRLRSVERRRPPLLPSSVPWTATVQGLEVRGAFFSNELFDALPVHVLRGTAQGMEEAYVRVEDHKLTMAWREPSRADLRAYLERFRMVPREGERVEVNLDALTMLRDLARSLEKGLVLTIDYGGASGELQARSSGTLAATRQHKVRVDPLAEPGEQDVTAHVNFTALEEEGRALGLDTLARIPQWQFLAAFGALDSIAARLQDPSSALDALAAKQLIAPGRMGEFQVLVQSKALDEHARRAILRRLQAPNLRT